MTVYTKPRSRRALVTRHSFREMVDVILQADLGDIAGLLSVYCNKASSVQFSCSVMSDSLQPHEPQHARPPCPSPTPGVYPNSCPLSQSCHSTISSSVVPFSSCPQSFIASGSFQMSQLFASGGQVLEFQLQHHAFQ